MGKIVFGIRPDNKAKEKTVVTLEMDELDVADKFGAEFANEAMLYGTRVKLQTIGRKDIDKLEEFLKEHNVDYELDEGVKVQTADATTQAFKALVKKYGSIEAALKAIENAQLGS